MLEKIEGKVTSYKAITKRNVQFELQGVNKIIELSISEAWVINKSDHIVVAGEIDAKSGKFIAYAYKNISKDVYGQLNPGVVGGYFFVLIGLFFFWAVFPLFTHIPTGLKVIALGKKVNQAATML